MQESSSSTSALASISGSVFGDLNDDGARESGESGLSGRIVTLVNSSGVEVAAAVTDANGNYTFAGLAAGSYTLQFEKPDGTAFSPIGTASGVEDSTVSYSGTAAVNLAAGSAATVYAGIYTLPTITGLPQVEQPATRGAIDPFSGVVLTGFPEADAVTTASIALSNGGVQGDAAGKLSGAGLTETSKGSGVYVLSAASPAALQAAIRQLVFTPKAGSGNTAPEMILTVTQGSQQASAFTVVTETCFLAGTLILTERGEIAVEALLPGERVATVVDGMRDYKPILWIGSRHVDAVALRRSGLQPVRIRAGAFFDEIPKRDLLVTPEHCIFIGGRLVPARMLVNGASIVSDDSIGDFTYYHIELEAHGVLLAEGLPTESYLDTGNRGNFSSEKVCDWLPRLTLDPAHKSWAIDACAPLATDRATVEPIWTWLSERSLRLGMRMERPRPALSDDPHLRLLLDNGEALTGCWDNHERCILQIPNGRKPVRLLSRNAAPADIVGPFVDDRRRLGIMVSKIVFWSGLQDTVIEAGRMSLAGWYAEEAGGRWTDGNAALELPRATQVDTFVEVRLSGRMLYEAVELDTRAAA